MLHKSLLPICLTVCLLAGCGGGGSSSGGNATPPTTTTPPPAPTAAQMAEASKFLNLATFGPTYDEIENAASLGPSAWLDAQFSAPISEHSPIVQRYIAEYGFDVTAEPAPGLYRRFAFWESAIEAPDQLRQLTAYALTQIFVVSDNVDAIFIDPRALSSYYDMLLTNAFGNFRDLLRDVTLHPAMGLYLSHVNNSRSNPVTNTFPDENYAREVMQLFTIGLYELNPDGTRQLDAQGQFIATYDNADIREFSKIFTGLSYGPAQPGGLSFFGKTQPVLHQPMRMFEDFHEPGQKLLLNGALVPDGQTGLQDIDSAIDNLFNHPNVGRFIGKQLIQRLVTSNPSPEYVARVASAFDGDGATPRGDMRATLRAILLDPEVAQATRLREPFRRYVALNRSLNVTSDDGTLPAQGFVVQFLTQQNVLSAPSVFNFYSPEFSPAGPLNDAGLVAPEFQITNDSSIIGMANLVAYAVYGDVSIDSPDGFTNIRTDLSEFTALANNTEALMDRIDLVFFGNEMDAETRSAILSVVNTVSAAPDDATRVALYLALSSPAYAIAGGTL